MTDVVDPKKRQIFMDISAQIERAIRAQDPTLFFAVFMDLSGELIYLANGERAEIKRLLRIWVDRTTFKLEQKKMAKNEKPSDMDARLGIERICADIGKKLTLASKVALFLFKNNEHCEGGVGINAHFASLPNARNRIDAWPKGQEQSA